MASALQAVGFFAIAGYTVVDLDAWGRAGLAVERDGAWDLDQLVAALRDDSVELVDVRELEEWAAGHVAGLAAPAAASAARRRLDRDRPPTVGRSPSPARPATARRLRPACCAAPVIATWCGSPTAACPIYVTAGSSSNRAWLAPSCPATLHPEDAVADVGERCVGRRRERRAPARRACRVGRSRRRPKAARSRSTGGPDARTARVARRRSRAGRPRSSRSLPARRPSPRSARRATSTAAAASRRARTSP